MNSFPLVSVIVIFYNAERYIKETIESIFSQTYFHWELLLVDDGSTDASTNIAQDYAEQRPDQIRYLEHPGHVNCGMSASRNLGIKQSKGKYIAFLDADDVWFPNKLEDQICILESHPNVGMLYGQDLYWYSWTQNSEDAHRDFIPTLGLEPNRIFNPPELLPLLIQGKTAIPCPCSILVRRTAIDEIGGFVNIFTGLYEDQAFYAKVFLKQPVYVTNVCWDKYRQHPGSITAGAEKTGEEQLARRFFLEWLQGYLGEKEYQDKEIWQSIKRELWRLQHPIWLPEQTSLRNLVRWIKKWTLFIEERLLPTAAKGWLWGNGPGRH
jgi:glycosyltransferase involved in cell wall biosynthesis